MKTNKYIYHFVSLVLYTLLPLGGLGGFTSCSESPSNVKNVDELPPIYPDYIGVTIPVGIAPMDFDVLGDNVEYLDVVVNGQKGGEVHSNGKIMDIDVDEWHQLVEQNKGSELTFTVCAKVDGQWTQYKPFKMYVSNYSLDEWGLTYRRVAPGYEVFSEMGLYQRDLSNFEEYEIISNTRTPGMCVNCHTSNRTNPTNFLFHARGENPVTVVQKDGKHQLLSTKTPETIGLCVYPYWHPDGRYIAFSTNTTRQAFHIVKDERIEVVDLESDLQVLDTETNELIIAPQLKKADAWETYPAFSPDGKTLYFCSAQPQAFPQDYKKVKYSLCSVSFDAKTAQFGAKIDTLLNANDSTSYSPDGRPLGGPGGSLSFPKPSYDGKYIMYTKFDYGCFPIWHKEADLYLLDLKTGESRPLTEVNCDDTDSYHNWNTNSHWFVFASRRDDGLYTRLYLSSIDDKGKATKPFLLPQKNPKHYYQRMMHSYNVPDFTSQKIEFDARSAANEMNAGKSVQVKVK